MAIKDSVKFFIFFNMILISCSKDEIIIDHIENNDEISEKFNCINCEDSVFIFRINTLGGEIVDDPKIPSALLLQLVYKIAFNMQVI